MNTSTMEVSATNSTNSPFTGNNSINKNANFEVETVSPLPSQVVIYLETFVTFQTY